MESHQNGQYRLGDEDGDSAGGSGQSRRGTGGGPHGGTLAHVLGQLPRYLLAFRFQLGLRVRAVGADQTELLLSKALGIQLPVSIPGGGFIAVETGQLVGELFHRWTPEWTHGEDATQYSRPRRVRPTRFCRTAFTKP